MSERGDFDYTKEFGSVKNIYSPERDPFLCTCGPCKKFWRDTFSDSGDLLRESSQCRAHHTAILSAESKVVKIGDRILVQSRFPVDLYGRKGTVKWVGVLDEDSIAPELYVGVRLDDNVNSTHNGVYNGKRYFHVPRGHGAMVKYMEVVPLKFPEKRPPMQGNYMFPSWDEVQKRRKERNSKLQNIYSQAGMQGPQFVEPYASPPKTAATSVRASPVKSLREPIIHIGDPNDIALRDMQRLSQMDTKRKVRKEDKDKKEMERFKQHFGGVPEADRLALTLKKLKLAYQEGKTLMQRKTVKDYDAGSDSGISDFQ
ncbi:dynactin subunit 1-like isoform X2 [Mya arenaria]|uniref:dynactin subunit 1-like isoform X2 n=1 Tax=Mya arenaria TaxID=6604 RepID=UPI0022E76D77|nr:dynactin subunit 1-like isoform X2 [Mya arenaria]XP_052818856.1 dynactin subunit 1-like isoform X2 [Mya arenaria]